MLILFLMTLEGSAMNSTLEIENIHFPISGTKSLQFVEKSPTPMVFTTTMRTSLLEPTSSKRWPMPIENAKNATNSTIPTQMSSTPLISTLGPGLNLESLIRTNSKFLNLWMTMNSVFNLSSKTFLKRAGPRKKWLSLSNVLNVKNLYRKKYSWQGRTSNIVCLSSWVTCSKAATKVLSDSKKS